MTDFVDPIVIAQINGAKDELVAEIAKLQPAVTKIENYAGSLDSAVPEAPIDGKQYARKDATWVEVSGGGGGTTPTPTPAVWGDITGTLSAQTDLQAALNLKANDSAISTVGKSGQYSDLVGKPTILPEAPNDGKQYARKNLGWSEVAASAIPVNPVFTGTTTFKVSSSGVVSTVIDSSGDSFGLQTPDAFDKAYYRGFKCDANGMAAMVDGVEYGRVLKGPDSPTGDNKQYVRKNRTWVELVAPAPTVTWGSISGTLSAQTDLQNALNAKASTTQLNAKQDKLVSGTNIKTINGNSLLGSGDLVISGGGGAGSKFEAIYSDSANYIEQTGNVALAGGVRYTVPLATMKTWFNKQVRINVTPTGASGATKIYSFDAPDATVNYGDCFTVIMSSNTYKLFSDFEFDPSAMRRWNTTNTKYDDGAAVVSGDGGSLYFEFVCAKKGTTGKTWLLRSYVAY